MKIYQMVKDEDSGHYKKDESKWEKVRCICGSERFAVIYTAEYETAVKCLECGFMDTIHDG